MAGIWTSAGGMDVNPRPDGPEHQPFIERYELQPIDAQTNRPQLRGEGLHAVPAVLMRVRVR